MAGSQVEPAAASALVCRCRVRLQSGDLAGAEALCREALQSKGGDAPLLHLLGVIVARRGRREEAAGLFAAALQAQSHFPEAWNSRGTVLAELGRLGEALAAFDRALTDRPDYFDALANRGDAFRALGRPEKALANYVRCLALKPGHPRIVSRCGAVLAELGRNREALDHHDRASRLAPDDPEIHTARGDMLAQLGHHAMALAAFARAISLRPDYVEAFISNAKLLAAIGRPQEALDSFDRALALDPTHSAALRGRSQILARSSVLAETGEPKALLEAFDRALALDPDLPQALIGKGTVLSHLGHYGEALGCFDRALQVSPELGEAQARRADVLDSLRRHSLAEAHCYRANTLYAIEEFAQAVAAYDQAIALHPDNVDAWNGRGLALVELGELGDALASYDRAARIRPRETAAHANRSAALRSLGRLDEALAATDLVLAREAGNLAALNNRGNTLRALGRLGEAIECYERAIAAEPNNAQSHLNRALCWLSAGDFRRGWAEYEWRSQLPAFEKGAPRLHLPRWLGEEDIAGRTIVLYAEQGHGDTIQFCRYVPLVAAKGAAVVLAAQPLLTPLLRSLPGIARFAGPADRILAADFCCSLLSLPLAFATELTTIPAVVPYLRAPPAKLRLWQEKLGARRGLRLGIAWSGNVRHKSDRERTIPLAALAPIAALDLPLYCLQREMRPSDLPDFAMFPNIEYFGEQLVDFGDTAGLIAQLDLVVTVDTAVAHLAGAMGKPVWVLLPQSPDWRWMMHREDSPWYPTMRLFRQPRPGDWQSVLDRISRELAQLQ
jgi:tetratricopeptide (TPR) repeat protein